MTLDDLRQEVRRALRTDLARARRLVGRYARRARASGDAVRVAEAEFFRGEVDLAHGRPRPAAARYATARRAFTRAGASGRVVAVDVSALQAHAQLGRRADAMRTLRALRRRRLDRLTAAYVETAAGSAFESLGDDAEAARCYARALTHTRARRDPPAADLRARARAHLGIHLARRGRVKDALRHLDEAVSYFRENGHAQAEAEARYNRGWARGIAGDSRNALLDLGEARARFQAGGEPRLAALAGIDEAEVLARLGDFDRASARARAAATALRRHGVRLDAARGDLLAARAEAARRRRGAARRLAERARTEFERAEDRAGAAMSAVVLGRDLARAETALRRSGHWIAALDALLARAHAATPAAGARLLAERAPRYPAALRRWVQPEILRLRAAAGGADRIPLLRRAFRAAEALRQGAPTGGLRAAVLLSHLDAYEELARALLDRGRPRDRREAFLVLDAARARTMREEMRREAPDALEAPAVRAVRRRLEALWRALERLDRAPGDLRTGFVHLLTDVAACERELLVALESAEGPTASAAAAAELPSAPCLAFACVGDELVGMLARDGSVDAWTCGPVAGAVEELDAFRFQVVRRLHGAEDARAARGCLERLGARLLEGVLDDPPPGLSVVLPAELGALPVEALPVRGTPLLETTVVSHVPCACAPDAAWQRTGDALVVGIESQRLPAVAKEIRFVARRLEGARRLGGARADRARILDALEDKRIVHLAGHAQAREDAPLLSALQVKDGLITATDLAGRRVAGALVVLSACRTGDPSLLWRGEGMAGFPRALLGAGAAAIVASRWEVPDAVAHAWMRAFYAALDDRPPAAALARAARRLRRSHPHPGDWAAFLLIRRGIL